VGWPALGDLSQLSEGEFETRADEISEQHGYKRDGTRQAWAFSQIPEGALVVANKGTTEVLGIGRVTGPYRFESSAGDWPHQIPVEWFDTRCREVTQPGWRRTLVSLNRSTFESIRDSLEASTPSGEAARISERTFDLLAGLHQSPTRDFYAAKRA
jgi:5-methylcytosine-specific restriction protein B